jgi:hypothetical protein
VLTTGSGIDHRDVDHVASSTSISELSVRYEPVVGSAA